MSTWSLIITKYKVLYKVYLTYFILRLLVLNALWWMNLLNTKTIKSRNIFTTKDWDVPIKYLIQILYTSFYLILQFWKMLFQLKLIVQLLLLQLWSHGFMTFTKNNQFCDHHPKKWTIDLFTNNRIHKHVTDFKTTLITIWPYKGIIFWLLWIRQYYQFSQLLYT